MNNLITVGAEQTRTGPLSGQIELTVNNMFPDDLEVRIFGALQSDAFIQNNLFKNPALSDEGLRQALTQSILGGFGSLANTAIYLANGNKIIRGTGVEYISVSSDKYPYQMLMEFLKTGAIYITKCRLYSLNSNQLKRFWYYKKFYPNGQAKSTPLDLSQVVTPDQVQNNIAEFLLNRTIDRFTSIDIAMLANTSLQLTLDFTSKITIEL